ncbi:MAG: NAD(P)-dependent oxidoreductase [Microcystis sp.]|uniref:NAD(P)-dependent oxidoreductase n=1 Tax=Microcystis sp. TaxID=1127 RepID=UPI00391C806F
MCKSSIISLHCPLTPENHYLINADTIAQMKPSVTLINTSRGKLIDTKAVIDGIKSGQIGSLGLDVYEQEDSLFFRDLSGTIIQDDYIQLLQSFPNVLITSHQGFFTEEAISAIANTTITSITDFEQGNPLKDAVQLSVISYQLSVISYQLSVISYQLSVISYQLSVISYHFTEKTPHTPHPTPYTPHPTPYTLHPTPYTPHPTPHTPSLERSLGQD